MKITAHQVPKLKNIPSKFTSPAPSALTHSISNQKILVVEDNLLNQKVAKLLLEQLGYDADIASSGIEALTMFDRGYSLILMDVGLPDIDGVEVTKLIRAKELNSKHHIPIIALTANGNCYKGKCLAVGMDGFALKPIMIDELKQVLIKFTKQLDS